MAAQLSAAVVHSGRVRCLGDDAVVGVSTESTGLQHAATRTSGAASSHSRCKFT